MSAIPTTIHSEHLVLMRDRDPWSLPVRLLQPEVYEPLQDPTSEDFVLSWMLDNPGRVQSLSPQDFTGRDRPVIYAALKEHGDNPELLDKLDERLDCPGYISQLRWQTSHCGTRKGNVMAEVENLKRLRELRDMAEKVDEWRRKLATLTPRAARLELAKVCFPRMSSSEPRT